MIAQTHRKIFSEPEDTRGLVVRVFVALEHGLQALHEGHDHDPLARSKVSDSFMLSITSSKYIGKSGNIDTCTKGVGGEVHDSR